MTPFQELYGRLPPTLPSYQEGTTTVNKVDLQLINRDELLQQLKHNLANSINRMKQLADCKRRELEFQIGDWVLLKLHPYRQQTAFKWVYQKLSSRYFGPYKIVTKIGPVAYKLALPEQARIHLVFLVSLLKPYHQNDHTTAAPTPTLPTCTDEGVVLLEPQKILDTRWVKRGAKMLEEQLVQWKFLPPEEATWEPTNKLQEMFPKLNLEDKIPLEEGSDDRP